MDNGVREMSDLGIEILKGKVIRKIIYDEKEANEIIFEISDDEIYMMHHEQDCCESVNVEDIIGELEWLIDSPILRAEERSNSEDHREDDDRPEEIDESFTWTFYEIATLKGAVTIRWYGSSNGYYSESVNIERVE